MEQSPSVGDLGYYKTLFDYAPDGILITNKKLVVLETNRAFEEMSGLSRDQIVGRGAVYLTMTYAPKESIKALYSIIVNTLKGDPVLKTEVHYKGRVLSLSTEIKQNPNYSIGIIRDVTAEKELLAKSKENEQKYKTLVESSDDGIVILVDGKIKYANPKAALLSQLEYNDLINKDFTFFLADHQKKSLIKNYLKRLKGKVVSDFYEMEICLKDQSIIDAEIRIIPIRYEGEVAQQVVIKDVTEQNKIKKQLINQNQELSKAKDKAIESDRLKSAFLANIGHEIRTPMNGILGFTDILKETPLPKEQQIEYLDIIQKGGKRMLNTINDLMDISKIESGQMKLVYSSVNISAMLKEVYRFFVIECKLKGVHLQFDNNDSSEDLILKCDFEKVNAIFINLVKNAIKFTSEGSIHFGYQIKKDNVLLYVKDTGIGIPKEKQAYIFDRFVQVDHEGERYFEGTGLGLSICESYVEMMQGEIWLESVNEVGSTFFFTLPR